VVGKNGPNDEDNAKKRRDEFLQRRGMSGDPPGDTSHKSADDLAKPAAPPKGNHTPSRKK
jgi:hypothetical protein